MSLFVLFGVLSVAWVSCAQSVHGAAYIIWGAGSDYPQPEPGFELATLADLKADAFVEYYNVNGFTDIQQNLNGCCVFKLQDGYLVIGSSSSYTYLAPYTASGAHQCSANLQSPVFFGGAYGVGPQQGQYIGKLTPADVEQLNVVPTMVTALGCGGLQNTFGIYRKTGSAAPTPPPTPPPTPSGPPYVVYGAGQAFPTPPPGYTMMSFRDVASSDFINYYNANYLTDLQQDMLGCCVFNTTDGYVTIGDPGNFSYLGPFTADGQFQCRTQLSNPVAFGGEAVVGPYALQFIGQLTPALVAKLSYNPVLVQGLCGGSVNSFGLYKARSAPPAPTPSGPPYVVYGAGQAYPTGPSGYRLISFKEFNTPDFINYYNANYLPNVQEDLSGCCVFNTTDGYITIGDPGNFSYLGPFTPAGQFQCVPNLQSPVAFGGEAVVGPYAMQFIGQLTPALVAKLSYNPVLVQGLCQGTVNSFGIYIRQDLRKRE